MESISNRYKLLSELIKDILDDKYELPLGLVSVFYMYYDSWNGILNEEWRVITEYETT